MIAVIDLVVNKGMPLQSNVVKVINSKDVKKANVRFIKSLDVALLNI